MTIGIGRQQRAGVKGLLDEWGGEVETVAVPVDLKSDVVLDG
jgi:hypothetical protein